MYYDYIQISKINDFLFCPRSLYFHSVYENFDDAQYKARPQIAGTLKHASVDSDTYSSQERYMQGTEVFSAQYGIIGKIDVYNKQSQTLIEKKNVIKQIHIGYLFQLYAEKLAIEEMGFPVKKMVLHSLTDNKKYTIKLTKKEKELFAQTLKEMRGFRMEKSTMSTNIKKCAGCIYRELCQSN